MADLSIVALLPIKAHSQRIEGKNFKLFAGKPLFRWCLDMLLSIPEISKVVINTDARNLLLENGIIDSPRILIRERKPQICGDMVSMNLIIADDVVSVPADIYLQTHVTNPLLSSVTTRKAIARFVECKEKWLCDSLFSVTRYQSRFYRKDATPINHNPNELIRTQDLEPLFEENSNLYIFSRQSFEEAGNKRIGKKPVLFETPFLESLDLDEQRQWDLAESILTGINKRKSMIFFAR